MAVGDDGRPIRYLVLEDGRLALTHHECLTCHRLLGPSFFAWNGERRRSSCRECEAARRRPYRPPSTVSHCATCQAECWGIRCQRCWKEEMPLRHRERDAEQLTRVAMGAMVRVVGELNREPLPAGHHERLVAATQALEKANRARRSAARARERRYQEVASRSR